MAPTASPNTPAPTLAPTRSLARIITTFPSGLAYQSVALSDDGDRILVSANGIVYTGSMGADGNYAISTNPTLPGGNAYYIAVDSNSDNSRVIVIHNQGLAYTGARNADGTYTWTSHDDQTSGKQSVGSI